MGNALKISRIMSVSDSETESALEELKTSIQNEIAVGSSVPDKDTVGRIYIKLGTSITDALTLYWKDKNGNWNGG